MQIHGWKFQIRRKRNEFADFMFESPHFVSIRSPKLAPQRRSQRHMGGHMQQTNAAAATALYDAGPANDAGDAVMARWLQSAGLQHLGSPVASTGNNDQRHLPNLLMQTRIAESW
ncbi:hypothetical protein F2Q68_00045781 [Brassica cretica]|uniref:Uncharacterized protein n=1 Tax=Brassica cretica TaxID=69181 RepID=A0A8S9LN37_BRACR|nr:hypothetical protein F2Q68_00045781 [Brassica cretica]